MYGERLGKLDLYSVEFRRVRGDYSDGLDRLDTMMFPPASLPGMRGDSLRIRGRPLRTEKKFLQRAMNLWNSLPQKAVEITEYI